MIKRIIACLTICLIITGLISPVFSDASALPQPNWSDPGISEIINISDLTAWMLNGGTFDVSQYTNAESFMNDYFNARTKTRLVSPGEVQDDYYEVLPGFGINNQLVAGESFANPLDTNRVISSSFRDHTGYGRRFSEQVNDALLSSGHLYETKIPLLNEIEFANFVGYNHNALNLYRNSFILDSPGASPDPNYPFINYINNLYYTSGNGTVYNVKDLGIEYHRTNASGIFYCISNDGSYVGDDFTHNHVADTNNQTCSFSYFNKIRIDLNSSNPNNVTATYSQYPFTQKQLFDYLVPSANTYYDLWVYENIQNVVVNGGGLYQYTQSSFTSLSGALNYIYQHYSNIDLYVDDVPWALSSNSITITPEFPDAVGGEELPSTTWPISRPRAPYYTNVPGVLNAIEDAIADDGKLDIDDLKPYLTDENGDPVPDPIFDPEPVPIPVPDPVNPDVVPGLPILPAMPPEMPGFNGVSVLAEIINFTNQSLPTSLIVTFWGIVFGIVILGLIKILHK